MAILGKLGVGAAIFKVSRVSRVCCRLWHRDRFCPILKESAKTKKRSSSVQFGLWFAFFLTTSCIPPLASHETARTLGSGNQEIQGGLGVYGHVLKWNFGLTQDLDVGIQWETFNLGLRAKYAFIHNAQRGFSLATAVGGGNVTNGTYYYGDLIVSYLAGDWEPYGTIRASHINCDSVVDHTKTNPDFADLFKCDRRTYDRIQLILGTKYWLNEQWFLTLEGGKVFAAGVDNSFPTVIGSSIGRKF